MSKGREPIPIADWRGNPMADAVAALTKAGLKVTQARRRTATPLPEAMSSRAEPGQGAPLQGDTVTLVESKGPVRSFRSPTW